jgi:hypothetical protein
MHTETRDQPNAIEHLPFVIRCVRDEAELAKAVAIRRSAYGRHVPELAARFAAPEPSDLDGSSRVLVALAKLDGACRWAACATAPTNRPLDLEQSVTLPRRCAAASWPRPPALPSARPRSGAWSKPC